MEDKRTAVNIHAGIGGQVLAGSLVLMGIILGYFDIRNIGIWSFKGGLLLLALFLLIGSIITGALGLKKIRDNGQTGSWEVSDTHTYFRWQTLTTGFSLFIFIIVFFLPSESSQQEKELVMMNEKLGKIIVIDSTRVETIKQLAGKVDSIQKHNDSLRLQVNKLQRIIYKLKIPVKSK